MRDWIENTLWVAGIIVVAAFFSLLLIFSTVSDTYIIKNPTQTQVETLVRGNSSNRVWFDDAAQLYQGSSLIKMSFRARFLERDKISGFLEEVEVEYELIEEGR